MSLNPHEPAVATVQPRVGFVTEATKGPVDLTIGEGQRHPDICPYAFVAGDVQIGHVRIGRGIADDGWDDPTNALLAIGPIEQWPVTDLDAERLSISNARLKDLLSTGEQRDERDIHLQVPLSKRDDPEDLRVRLHAPCGGPPTVIAEHAHSPRRSKVCPRAQRRKHWTVRFRPMHECRV